MALGKSISLQWLLFSARRRSPAISSSSSQISGRARLKGCNRLIILLLDFCREFFRILALDPRSLELGVHRSNPVARQVALTADGQS
ncbi:hypothetical protein PanWU01x14_109480 [Parasponia andersonii]|uniref:Uncharacterized protein n=1 Tax=Parasponia andersonii TaxID=3476 RepID=A0A2P5CZQ8_PARAD|nr:hypothetical protein PanWU01x14_109480 [Parasponia andersonii]